eukprot:gene3866-7716_t
MEDKPNFRSVGRTSIHLDNKIERMKRIKNRFQNTVSSMPSKWEPRVLPSPSPAGAFGTQSQRFLSDNQLREDLPGPGFYKNPEQLLQRNPSYSKNGANSFLSKKEKVDYIPKYKLKIPGPGDYDIAETLNSPSVNKKGSVGFVPSGNGRVPFPISHGKEPGPGSYNIRTFKYNKKGFTKSSSYKSIVPRAEFLIQKSPAPPIGTYNSVDPTAKIEQEIGWSRLVEKRLTFFGVDNDVPGPCQYFKSPNDKLLEEGASSPTPTRPYGTFTGPLRPGSPGLDLRPTPVNNVIRRPSSSEVSRFHNSPGWYDPLQYINSSSNNGSANFNTNTNNNGTRLPSAEFRSTSPNRKDILKPISLRTPGPAYYNPVKPTSKNDYVRWSTLFKCCQYKCFSPNRKNSGNTSTAGTKIRKIYVRYENKSGQIEHRLKQNDTDSFNLKMVLQRITNTLGSESTELMKTKVIYQN